MKAKVLAVRFEGTLSSVKPEDVVMLDLGQVNTDVREFLKQLKDDYYIYIVSGLANTNNGVRMLQMWLHDNEVEYDDIWQAYGFPAANVTVDNLAVRVGSRPGDQAKKLKS
jgi:gamma-glutamyl:cysteine ligase YbdK (ATP-grasp superfamily)